MAKSKQLRENPLFLRNEFDSVGEYNIPIVKKQKLDTDNIKLIAYSNIRSSLSLFDKMKGVHFFVDDNKFNGIYDNPKKSIDRISRFLYTLTPDYSLYIEMAKSIQIMNVYKNRWLGAYWQSKGLTVIPTVSWSLAQSFEFCFDGIEKGSIVAVSTVGCLKSRLNFLRGYNELLNRIEPEKVICYGKIFKEMDGNIISVPYNRNRKEVI